ncbi:hypothetical protein ACSBR2_015901 [Camellia fascicularis]
MMLGLNTKTGEKHFLSSWKTEDDPSPGKFVCGITPETSPQAFIWNGSKPYSRSGTVNIMRWDEQVKRWHVGWNVPVHPCDTYGVCGPSGLCNRDQSPNCGCVRNNELLCQKNTTSLASSGKAHNDRFWKLTSMKLPDNYEYLYNEDSSGCQQWCSSLFGLEASWTFRRFHFPGMTSTFAFPIQIWVKSLVLLP